MAHRLLSVLYCCAQIFRAYDRLVDCGNSYTLRSFMLMKCHCLLVTSNSTSNRPLIFNVFSYTGVYASPFGVRSTVSLSLRLVVPRVLQLLVSLVPTGAIFEISNTRPIFSWNFYLYQPGAGSLCLWSCFMIWKDTLFIHNYFKFTFMHIWAFLTFGLSLYV